MSQFDWFFEEISSGIRGLVERFIEMPYFFYSEQDMHAYLYYKLISGKLGEFFDLAISDPKYASESHWRMQVRKPPYSRHRLKAAFELSLNAIGTARLDLMHFGKDFERLTNPENKVERGYLLFFVRRQDYLPNSGLLRMKNARFDSISQVRLLSSQTKPLHASTMPQVV